MDTMQDEPPQTNLCHLYVLHDEAYGIEGCEQETLLLRDDAEKHEFAWVEYISFFTIGMSMMWTWSMILQAVPYLQRRFESNSWILRNFQAYNLVVFALTISTSSIVLTRWTARIDFTKCLKASLLAFILVAMALSASSSDVLPASAEIYFPFILLMVFITGVAYATSQQAAFAFVAGFIRPEYAPAIITGEALAGLLPSIIEILSVLIFPSYYFDKSQSKTSSSLLTALYFSSGVFLGTASLMALKLMIQRNDNATPKDTRYTKHDYGAMWRRLKWPAISNFLCLCIGSVSPVFASKIISVVPEDAAPILQRHEAFIPLAIVLWNIGDLLGSVLAIFSGGLARYTLVIFFLNVMRLALVPLYLLCNIEGRGSFAGDWFYLFVVQFTFGLSQGWLIATSMSGVATWVDEGERESAGAFMGLAMVTGLIAGSFFALAAAQA